MANPLTPVKFEPSPLNEVAVTTPEELISPTTNEVAVNTPVITTLPRTSSFAAGDVELIPTSKSPSTDNA